MDVLTRGIWPIVVDHMLKIRAAWKKSTVCGTFNNPAESKLFASSKNVGARFEADS